MWRANILFACQQTDWNSNCHVLLLSSSFRLETINSSGSTPPAGRLWNFDCSSAINNSLSLIHSSNFQEINKKMGISKRCDVTGLIWFQEKFPLGIAIFSMSGMEKQLKKEEALFFIILCWTDFTDWCLIIGSASCDASNRATDMNVSRRGTGGTGGT